MGQTTPKSTVEPRGPHSVHQRLGPPHSLRQMTARSVHALPHNYATNAPLVTMGSPKFTPKTAPSPSTITIPSNTPILDQSHSPPQTVSGSNQPFCHNTLCALTKRQTDRQSDRWTDRPTDRPTDGPGECSVTWVLTLESDALKIQMGTFLQHSVDHSCKSIDFGIKK